MNAQASIIRNAPFDRSLLGGKAMNLALLQEAGFNVPAWFAITPQAFYQSMSREMRERFRIAEAPERASIASNVRMSFEIRNELNATIATLGWEGKKLAVRSSGADEDGLHLSYAGQFHSYLNVELDGVVEAVEKVWRSGFSKNVMSYRQLNGVLTLPEPPSVVVQIMVPAAVAGVAFGADPVTGRTDVVTVSAVSGLADKLVSGESDSATYTLSGAEICMKMNEHLGPLSTKQLMQLNDVVHLANKTFGTPQDIEWAIDEGEVLYVLQTRAITTISAVEPARSAGSAVERLDIFDNSNIGESYPGITTPLTFSFARKAYQHVYEQFCKLMGVTDRVIEKNAQIFPQMLALVRGRIYYNLLNWYRLLSLFPGFKTNRRFMEQMMGVKEALPAEFLFEFDAELPLPERIADAMALARVLPVLLWKWIRLPIDIERFNRRVEGSLLRVPDDIKTLSLSQLASLYRNLEQDLLLRWDAPIVNDFFAMVAYGVLRGVCGKWMHGEEGLHNQLLCGETGIVSTEPVRRMNELADMASAHPELITILEQSNISKAESTMKKYPEFFEAYKRYLDKFGDRCVGELKLESATVRDNPKAFMTAIARLAAANSSCASRTADIATMQRTDAEAKVRSTLKTQPLRNALFDLVLWQARTRIRERENLRFLRTRVFGAVRLIFVEIGRQLCQRGLLDRPEDIFYLETEEVLRFIEGTSVSARLQVVADTRRNEFAEFEQMPAPADRLTVRGGVNLANSSIETVLQNEIEERVGAALSPNTPSQAPFRTLNGLGCCPGIVSGRARVVENPDVEQLMAGEILIAKRTDPGWITVIAQAKGIVVEYGSLLSHTAIVARELGIPTIVSVSNVTTAIKTGDMIEIDGAKGTVCVSAEIRALSPDVPINIQAGNLSAA